MNPTTLDAIIRQPAEEKAAVCEECGQEIRPDCRLTPGQYSAWLAFLRAWLQLPGRSRDIIAAIICRPGLTAREYCPRLSERTARAAVQTAQQKLAVLLAACMEG